MELDRIAAELIEKETLDRAALEQLLRSTRPELIVETTNRDCR